MNRPRLPKALGLLGVAVVFALRAATLSAAESSTTPSTQEAFRRAVQHGYVDLARAAGTPRPRSFADEVEWAAIRHAVLEGERKSAFGALLRELETQLRNPGIADSAPLEKGQDYAKWAKSSLLVKRQVDSAKSIAQGLAFAALVTGEPRYVDAARQHMLALASLDPRGATGVKSEDLSARHVAWTLALGLDWLYPHLSVDDRSRLVRAIAIRMEDFAHSLVRGPRPLERQPLDSHGNEVLGALAEIGVLLAGETALADRWMSEFVPLYARQLSPYGGADGGYANGTAYASWDLHEYSLRHWDTLRRVLGIDLSNKPWGRNIGRFLVYFLPPGTPAGNFGDAAEVTMFGTWALTAQAYASRVPDPLYRWYASQWFQQDAKALELLLAPLQSSEAATFPEGTPNAALFSDIGAIAMHSDLRDRGRTSVYFRSSPYGAASHGHSDQNSFTINVGGRRLLIDSGYYDYFGSPHHYRWTKRTVAHNAITFDGGHGQDDPKRPWGDEAARGKVLEFGTSADADWVVGDAAGAYSGAVTSARRGLLFLRPSTIVVFDHLSAAQPRVWEWNAHALDRFVIEGDGRLMVAATDVRACISFYANTDTTFSQTDRFTEEPERTSTWTRPNQWHGQFKVRQGQRALRSIAVIDIDCRSERHYAVDFRNDRSLVVLGDRELSFDGETIKFQRNGVQ